ncbi:hypothetical protein [Synechococcus sp. PCC 6312]|uniref:hypothetical protein n=1 Tax=Synechococcus sp. (strain ATCC 27167 / PCC 6312) TaxID=195253 RepID=UPI00029EDD9A|nr:hypothetical protein [Synechococcus sp. PCC 6312]AFY61556.1 hypothetical protein Syn6312_2455 [Synechococcus sp. PCC 6312]
MFLISDERVTDYVISDGYNDLLDEFVANAVINSQAEYEHLYAQASPQNPLSQNC